MKEKPWYERKIIVGMWIFIFILIIIGFISSLSDNKKEELKYVQETKEFNKFPEIGYLSLVEDDGNCEVGTIPIILWENSELTIIKDSIEVRGYDEFCSGGIRVLIEDVQENKVKILVSDRRFDSDPNLKLKNGWLLKTLVKARWED